MASDQPSVVIFSLSCLCRVYGVSAVSIMVRISEAMESCVRESIGGAGGGLAANVPEIQSRMDWNSIFVCQFGCLEGSKKWEGKVIERRGEGCADPSVGTCHCLQPPSRDSVSPWLHQSQSPIEFIDGELYRQQAWSTMFIANLPLFLPVVCPCQR